MTARAALLLSLAATCLAAPARADDPEYERERALVRLHPGGSIAPILAAYGLTLAPGDSIPSRGLYLLTLPEGADEPALIALLSTDPRISSADFNFFADDSNPEGSSRRMYLNIAREGYDSDPTPGRVSAPAAWSQSTGFGVTVAVLDTGVDSSHPLLAGRTAPGGYNFVLRNSDTRDIARGVDSNNNGEFDQMVGHGTMIAGLITRIAPEAKVLPVVVMDSDGRSTTFRLVQGVYHAIDRGAQVINISMVTEADPPLLRLALTDAAAAGIITAVAAGNSGSDNPVLPAASNLAGVVAVAATNFTDELAPFSGYGPWIALCAPGAEVVSTAPGGTYGIASGTSLSAPIVAGGAALVRSICPLISPAMVASILAQRADDLSTANPGREGEIGSGRLNAARAVGAIGTPLPHDCDRDNDRRITWNDLHLFAANPVDANGDGVVNAADYEALKRYLHRARPPAAKVR